MYTNWLRLAASASSLTQRVALRRDLGVGLVFVLAVAGPIAANASERSLPPEPANYRQQLNGSTVTIAAGPPYGTALDIAIDLAEVLDGPDLRVVPMVGKGVDQNVRDLRFMRGVDLGITQANILKYFEKTGELGPNITSQITYIAKLFNEEVHILAQPDTESIDALSGRLVSFGPKGSGADITAQLIFEALQIPVKPVHLGDVEAIRDVKSGRIAAAILIGGKPAPIARSEGVAGLKLLSIPYSSELEDDYYPATLTHSDYPDLVSPGEEVDTVAVCAVLVTFNWSERNERYRKVEKFVDTFFSRFEEFHQPPHHPKWQDVNYVAILEGWTRSTIAQRWIDRAEKGRATIERAQFEVFLEKSQDSNPSLADAKRAELYQAFLEWSKEREDKEASGQ